MKSMDISRNFQFHFYCLPKGKAVDVVMIVVEWNENPFFSIKPSLKKVSKYENKFAKLQKKAAEFNFRNQLKTVKKKEFTMDDDQGKEEHKKPDWALGEKEGKSKSVSEPPPEAAEVRIL